jgi:hypothetical protein
MTSNKDHVSCSRVCSRFIHRQSGGTFLQILPFLFHSPMLITTFINIKIIFRNNKVPSTQHLIATPILDPFEVHGLTMGFFSYRHLFFTKDKLAP